MSWLEQLRDASFRGVAFQVDSARNSGGRRANVIEFPMRDKPQVNDMGKRAKGFSFEAYVIGADYMASRDALIAALEARGPGPLVHPYLGEITVQIGEISWEESTRYGGMATFSIQCHEYFGAVYPQAVVDTREQVAQQAAAAGDAAEQAFQEDFSAEGQPEFVVDGAVALVREMTAAIEGALSQIPTLPEGLTAAAESLTALSESASALVMAPGDLSGRARALMNQLRLAADRPRSAFSALQGLFGFGNGLDAVPATTPTRAQEAANQDALVQLVQQLATLEAAQAAAQIDYESLDDALAVREALVDQFDLLAEQDISMQAYQALAATRASVATDIGSRGANLARLARIQLPGSLPSLVLAWQLYGDASRGVELVARNRIQDPLFLPSGVPLEVLDA